MNKVYEQIVNKIATELSKPEIKTKINRYIIDPLVHDIYQKTHNYFITIISLYIIILLLLFIILGILVYKKSN